MSNYVSADTIRDAERWRFIRNLATLTEERRESILRILDEQVSRIPSEVTPEAVDEAMDTAIRLAAGFHTNMETL